MLTWHAKFVLVFSLQIFMVLRGTAVRAQDAEPVPFPRQCQSSR